MNGIDRFERELPGALADVAGAGRPDYLPDVLGRTARTRQRPAWASAQRWLPMELVTPRATVAARRPTVPHPVTCGGFTTLPWNADTEPGWQRKATP